jgi:hypothetical protein
VNGSPSSPGIFFTTNPGTGIYQVADTLLFATIGIGRGGVGSTGGWVIDAPTDNITALTVHNNSVDPNITVAITSAFSSIGPSPLLSLFSSASNGWATLSLCGNNGTSGTTDFSLFQNGFDLSGNIEVNANANLNFFTNGTEHMQLDSGGSLHLIGGADTITLNQLTTSTATSGGATLPGAPVGFWSINVNGTIAKIPYYAN